MKPSIICLGAFVAFGALAAEASVNTAIDVQNVGMQGHAWGPSAEELIGALESLGVKPYTSGKVTRYEVRNGTMTSYNHACERGKHSFGTHLEVLDQFGAITQKIEPKDADNCTGKSKSAALASILDKFGASKLAGNCGMGTCDYAINEISCTGAMDRVPAGCTVLTNTAGLLLP